MNRRVSPVKHPSRLVPALLMLAVVAIGFGTLMVRLEVTEEGYRLSALRDALAAEQEKNRHLKVEAAELGSRQRLRAMAARYHLEPPRHGQVVMVP